MLVTIITLFPQIFEPIINTSIIKNAQEKNKVEFRFLDLRHFGIGPHKTVDDRPYGGGAGMVLRVDVMDQAIQKARLKKGKEIVILLDPKGEAYKQERAEDLSSYDHIILICGHYEGFDERIRDLVDIEISIGDYILTSGETAAIIIIDSVIRLIPGVLKKDDANDIESFTNIGGQRILEYPHYTRPPVYNGQIVPKELLSGNFKKIDEHRIKEAKKLTKKRRPDLL